MKGIEWHVRARTAEKKRSSHRRQSPAEAGKKSAAKKNAPKETARAPQPLTKPPDAVVSAFPVLRDFFEADWRDVPLRYAYGVYALCLFANLPDYTEVASEAITEGGDDKDCGLCLIDSEAGDAFVVQATIAAEWNKPTASTNKADDLLTAISWLLSKSYSRIPLGLRPKACIGSPGTGISTRVR